jgi:hypothetical protein
MALKMIIHTFAEKVHNRTGWSQKEYWVGKRRKRQVVVVVVVEVGSIGGRGISQTHTRWKIGWGVPLVAGGWWW